MLARIKLHIVCIPQADCGRPCQGFRVATAGDDHDMFGVERLERIRGIGIGESLRATALFGIDKQPVTAIRGFIQPAVVNVIKLYARESPDPS